LVKFYWLLDFVVGDQKHFNTLFFVWGISVETNVIPLIPRIIICGKLFDYWSQRKFNLVEHRMLVVLALKKSFRFHNKTKHIDVILIQATIISRKSGSILLETKEYIQVNQIWTLVKSVISTMTMGKSQVAPLKHQQECLNR